MKPLLFASISGMIIFIALSSFTEKTDHSNKVNEIKLEETLQDSVHVNEVRDLVSNELLSRLENQGGIKASWRFLDKSGHRTKIFTNVDTDFKNIKNNYLKLSDQNEVFGDIVRIDGSLRSHVCSFKIVYPEQTIFARRSVLDEWEDVKSFTGIEEKPATEKVGW